MHARRAPRQISTVALAVSLAVLAASCGGNSSNRPSFDPETSGDGNAAPSPEPEMRSFTVVAGGDVLIHPALTEQAQEDASAGGSGAYDFRPLFAGIAPVVTAADLALCHLETPLALPEGPFEGFPTFNAPPQVAQALAETGYDGCSTASNHTLDMGSDGVTHTLDALDAAGLGHTGSARSAQEAGQPTLYELPGVTVGHLSYTYGFNGLSIPEDQPWLANETDEETIRRAARTSRAAGADVVIVSMHWGSEFEHDPTDTQTELASALLSDPAIDLIVGHHAHVVQPFERIEDEWVAYGLGNQLARHSEPRGTSEEGVLARFTFDRDQAGRWVVGTAEYVPTLVELGPPIRLIDLAAALKAPDIDSDTQTRYTESLERTDQIVASRGADDAGLSRP